MNKVDELKIKLLLQIFLSYAEYDEILSEDKDEDVYSFPDVVMSLTASELYKILDILKK